MSLSVQNPRCRCGYRQQPSREPWPPAQRCQAVLLSEVVIAPPIGSPMRGDAAAGFAGSSGKARRRCCGDATQLPPILPVSLLRPDPSPHRPNGEILGGQSGAATPNSLASAAPGSSARVGWRRASGRSGDPGRLPVHAGWRTCPGRGVVAIQVGEAAADHSRSGIGVVDRGLPATRAGWCADRRGCQAAAGVRAGGIQGPVVNRRCSASKRVMPHWAAVDRWDCTTAKSASPCRVRQHPPDDRCWTLTGLTFRGS